MKICFWGNIAGALQGQTDGGGELQIALLAQALAKDGHDIVILDFQTTEDFVIYERIKVIKLQGWDKGIRVLRSFTHRLPLLYSTLKAQRADVYYCRIRDFRHILVYWAARKVNARFILSLASDLDAMNFLMRWKYQYRVSLKDLWSFSSGLLIEFIYPWLLQKADLVLVQHEGQRQILDGKKIRSVIFPNLIDLAQIPTSVNKTDSDFIYVGSLDKRKGFDEFFEIVKIAPFYTFKVIGQPRGDTGYTLYEKLKLFNNVSLLGRLNHAETMEQISKSKALISTSRMEGFPNVFIEAWACGIPVLSLFVDPGSVIAKEELGIVANGNFNELLHAMGNFKDLNEFAERAKAYVDNTHALNTKKVEEISRLFRNILKD